MIFTYNKEYVGDVLMIIAADNQGAKLASERKGRVARVYREDNDQTVAWNIFEQSDLFEIAERGQVFLTDEQVTILNQELSKEGFPTNLVNDRQPKSYFGDNNIIITFFS